MKKTIPSDVEKRKGQTLKLLHITKLANIAAVSPSGMISSVAKQVKPMQNWSTAGLVVTHTVVLTRPY